MLFITLFERMALVALAAYIFTHSPLFEKFFKKNLTVGDKVALIISFSLFSILGTYLGVRVTGGAIANIRPIGAIVAGYIGGPIVGAIVGAIAGGHRLLLGGFTGFACAIATIIEGLVGAYFRGKSHELSPFLGLLAGVVAETIQIFLVLLLAKPFYLALELEKEIGIPMIIINALGVAIFIDIIKTVRRHYNEIAAINALKSLNIAKQASVYLRRGLNKHTSLKIAEIIKFDGNFRGVLIGDKEKVLCYIGDELDVDTINMQVKDYFKKPVEKIIMLYNKDHVEIYFYFIPLIINDEIEGVLGIEVDSLDDHDKRFKEFLRELAELLAIQIEIYKLNKKVETAALSELKALRAQVHPHFLFNALNTIASFCRLDPIKARDLILDLSNYFRGTLKSEEFVTLNKELELIESYLNIEKARFGERIQIQYEIDEKLRDILIPQFILQPLVENAIKHGLTKKHDGGLVKIKVQDIKDKVFFEVSDTGIGIEKDRLKKVLKDSSGIGLKNINDRLKIYYGEGATLNIFSENGAGTKVSFEVPKEGVYAEDKLHNS
ncbi:LytS/YhcK type 5TM receptor domain-containing protein [Caloramator australicus]|uniref:histidine kinase n=1 Tax=Caloramator australicus RC3 TaxID=857293 RepID=I7KVG2_9CLOT|nr:LytS/YhcK type 5TM receptor domain-containing protein [Caloramator australicus]CCJ34009.1 Autolysis histidine kinase LytS [Caloramator australicus RC3]